MINIEEKINQLTSTPSDINEHLVTLTKYAKECDTVTEMGVRWGDSTWAFLYASPKRLRSLDIQWTETWDAKVADFEAVAESQNIDYKFILTNVLDVEIDECDLLFIDTWHAYKQLKAELAVHASKAKKYIILHDTTSFADYDESSYESWGDDWKGSGEGIWKAVEEFLQDNHEWELKERFTNNNGLTILARK
jgi:hypothetical protein